MDREWTFMPVAAFDTLKYARSLRDAGLPLDQADAQAAALADALSNTLQSSLQNLATRSDVETLRQSLDTRINKLESRIDQVEAKLESKFDQVEAKMESKFDQVEAKMDQIATKLDARITQVDTSLRGELILLRWMVGATLTAVVTIMVRLFFFRL